MMPVRAWAGTAKNSASKSNTWKGDRVNATEIRTVHRRQRTHTTTPTPSATNSWPTSSTLSAN